jgi:hypothetical protein
MTNTQTILESAEQAVQTVEQKLTQLNDTENKVAGLEKSIEELAQSESDLFAGDQNEEQKTKSLLKLRATADVRKSNLGKLLLEREELKDKAISLGIYADNYLCAVRDALVAARTDRVLLELGKLFTKNVIGELKRFAGFSLLVSEVESDGKERFTWVWSRPELGLSNCQKLRAEWNRLLALVEAEPEIEILVSSGWVVPTPPAIRGVAFAGSKS